MKILLITPPLLHPNTPYAATPLLAGWLNSMGHEVLQADLSLAVLLRLFSKEGLDAAADALGIGQLPFEGYRETVDDVISFLQGRNAGASSRIIRRGWLPEGPHLTRAYEQEEQLRWNFRGMDEYSRAKYLGSLYLDDIAEIASELDPCFGFSRYAEKMAVSLSDFDPMHRALEHRDSLFTRWTEDLSVQHIESFQPELAAVTIPFPGCLFGALTVARSIKRVNPSVHVAVGGGYVSTELRSLRDPGIFDYVDTVTLDCGYVPLQRFAERAGRSEWVRTFALDGGEVRYYDSPVPRIRHRDGPVPDYAGLPLDRYFGMMETLNPVTALWSDGRWNRLVLAHGCCWRRCAFCDTSIEYINRYDPADAETICDWIEQTMKATGFGGFHFVDEALSPDLISALCDALQKRCISIEWWGNIRFEKGFSRELIRKMAASGCIAVTGGLETCHDRTLKLMRKGIIMKHAVRVLTECAEAGILTHAYLMYGFPTQTMEETIQALDTIRQLFDEGILHSAYWHRFALTAHSWIARNPEAFGLLLECCPEPDFAFNEIPFKADFDHDPDRIGDGLKSAVYNYQLGMGLDTPVEAWFGT